MNEEENFTSVTTKTEGVPGDGGTTATRHLADLAEKATEALGVSDGAEIERAEHIGKWRNPNMSSASR